MGLGTTFGPGLGTSAIALLQCGNATVHHEWVTGRVVSLDLHFFSTKYVKFNVHGVVSRRRFNYWDSNLRQPSIKCCSASRHSRRDRWSRNIVEQGKNSSISNFFLPLYDCNSSLYWPAWLQSTSMFYVPILFLYMYNITYIISENLFCESETIEET